jgi:1,4-alpha-glucan branching enzyme
MPYVEGFGVWPFGEEWLWEAVATSYVPLLPLLEAGAPLTLSVTPVLLDQLEAPGVHERLLAFLRELRPEVHRQAAAALPAGPLRDEVERAAGDYARAAAVVEALGDGGLAAALERHATWTSSATHAVLPLLATDEGVRRQVRRRRPAAGFWLPECAWAPWLDPLLAAEGVRSVVVDLTDHGRDPLVPRRTPCGIAAAPLHRELVELVWSDGGYPSGGAYRDYHHYAEHRRRPWAVDGSPYDHARARAQARADAAGFAARVRAAVAGGGLAVLAFDTELFGEWWYEGVAWLEAVVGELGELLVPLEEALATEPAEADPLDLVSTWGTPRTLWTWSGPQVADIAWRTRAAELRALAAGPSLGADAERELLMLQASDWAFLATRGTAGPYPRERFEGHLAAFDRALG